MGIDEDGEEGPNNDDHFHHDDEDFSDLDLDEVPENINDKGTEEAENVHPLSVGNPSHGLVIRNDTRAYMLSVDSNVTLASEFPKYPHIIPTHWLAIDSELEELFIGQQSTNKENCVFYIKRYSMKMSVDYKV
ncbi:hypothetical protein PVK06_009036 [Gossypium arboreum]|uniref:Uncharacterized protein n=1 Tax=Gossypium arboreum TaxID=29729 RepID=A0ABR0QMI0_GOSAR|nr:hypothetical protein PVK06_009036 [Gossypium arboreum]